MEKVVFYIIIGIGYLIYSLYKNAKKADEERIERQRREIELARQESSAPGRIPGAAPGTGRTVKPNVPSSLEDLLKEFNLDVPTLEPAEEIAPPVYSNPVPPKNSQKSVYLDQPQEDLEIARAEIKRRDAEMERVRREGVSEKGDLHLEPYRKHEAQMSKFRKALQDPDRLKQAFITGEILKRKEY